MINSCRLISYPIRELGEGNMPISMASACVIDYKGKRLLLTVHHATGNQGRWAVELEWDPSVGMTKLHQLGNMYFMENMNVKTSEKYDVDFSFVKVDTSMEAYDQEINHNTLEIDSEQKRLVGNITFEEELSKDKKYCFSGWVKGKIDKNKLISENVLYHDLKYIKSEGDFHIFELPFDHPGHEAFKGCSGAPISDEDGNIVALVSKGNLQENTIYGLSLKKYKVAIDAVILLDD